MRIRQNVRYIKELREQNMRKPILAFENISYANWWRTDAKEIWFTRFIKYYWPSLNIPIRFYSVFGPDSVLKETYPGVKIFFSGENLEEKQNYSDLVYDPVAEALWQKRYERYSDYACGKVDLSLGFRTNESEKYMRFPLWIMYLFNPDDGYEQIKERVKEINGIRPSRERRGAVIIASHDQFGTRGKIYIDLKDVVDIACAGKWNNNTEDLWMKYQNNKLEYMQQFRFNICPENVDAPGYVTEKIFDAYRTGTIPVYCGSGNIPEPDIVRSESLILWNYNSDNKDNIALVKKLISDDDYYDKYVAYPRMTDYTAEYIYDILMELKQRFGALFS